MVYTEVPKFMQQGVLEMTLKIVMSEEPDNVAGLRSAIGRLVNAMVAVLGPELQLGSAAYNTTRALINDLQVSITLSDALLTINSFITPSSRLE